MITPRTRRKPQERAADILRTQLARLMKVTTKWKDCYEAALAEETSLRQQIAMLDPLPMPGKETGSEPATSESGEKVVYVITTPVTGVGKTGTPAAPENRLRIGEKAPSPCPHPQTGLVKGVRRCFVCNARVEG